jgi:hypothetical protein
MDSGEGKFIQTADIETLKNLKPDYPKHGSIFTIGEELEIKGSKFRVKDISPFGIKFKLLKRD